MTEVVIVSAVRTPIGKLGGVLSTVRPDDLAALVIQEAVKRAGIEPGAIEEVYMGCANQAGEDNRNVARMATLLAGLPEHVPAGTPCQRTRRRLGHPATSRPTIRRLAGAIRTRRWKRCFRWKRWAKPPRTSTN